MHPSVIEICILAMLATLNLCSSAMAIEFKITLPISMIESFRIKFCGIVLVTPVQDFEGFIDHSECHFPYRDLYTVMVSG